MGLCPCDGDAMSARTIDTIISYPDYTNVIAGAILGICLILLIAVFMREDTESMKGKMIIDNERIWK